MDEQYFAGLLKKQGLKVTQARLGVLRIISGKDAAVSQPELEKMLGDQVDRVTLYRSLATFQEKGILHKILDLNGTATYALCSNSCTAEHHHDQHVHFICSKCNNIYCLEDIQLPALGIPHGYRLQEISINAIGLCAACGNHVINTKNNVDKKE